MLNRTVVVVGHCTEDSAKILVVSEVESNAPQLHARIAFKEDGGPLKFFDFQLVSASPFYRGVAALAGLKTASTIDYVVDVADAQANLASPDSLFALMDRVRRFRLLPTGRPPRIALVSCNQLTSFKSEEEQFVLWRRLQRLIDGGKVDLIIHSGDQIYADADHEIRPDKLVRDYIWLEHRTQKPKSLQGTSHPTREQLIVAYRSAYFSSWSQPAVASVLASCPSIMMWDDHDLIDGWGARGDEDLPPMQMLFQAASQVAEEFQFSHNPDRLDGDDSYACATLIGDVALLCLDGRTHRRANPGGAGVILGDTQLRAVQNWLARLQTTAVKYLFVVQAKPVVFGDVQRWHLPIAGIKGYDDDLLEFWTAPGNQGELRRLLLTLFDFAAKHTECMISILTGDLHFGYVSQIESTLPQHRLHGAPARIYEVVSSGIGTKAPSGFFERYFVNQFIDEDAAIRLVDKDINGTILSLGTMEDLHKGKLLYRRNIAVLSMTNADGTQPDPHGNIWLEMYMERTNQVLGKPLLRLS